MALYATSCAVYDTQSETTIIDAGAVLLHGRDDDRAMDTAYRHARAKFRPDRGYVDHTVTILFLDADFVLRAARLRDKQWVD